MRQVREVLRLRTAGVGLNEIARRVGVAPSTVRLTLKRLASAGLSWPLPAEMTDSALETALFAAAGTKQGHRRHAEPDWAEIHRELKRKHVTLTMLWDEYIERCPEGYRYSRFCELYRGWASRLSVTMRQSHTGGDKLFVDYVGDTVPVIVDRLTGQVRAAQIFVAVMGASNFTYAEASWTQALADWIGAHTRAFAALGGVPKLLVPDNTKVAVIKACLYEPQVNRTYAEMAAHYDTAILPARPRRPRDKAKVEVAVLIIERCQNQSFACRSFDDVVGAGEDHYRDQQADSKCRRRVQDDADLDREGRRPIGGINVRPPPAICIRSARWPR
jgi:transposase